MRGRMGSAVTGILSTYQACAWLDEGTEDGQDADLLPLFPHPHPRQYTYILIRESMQMSHLNTHVLLSSSITCGQQQYPLHRSKRFNIREVFRTGLAHCRTQKGILRQWLRGGLTFCGVKNDFTEKGTVR